MKLIDDWRNWWKFWSIRIAAIFSVVITALLSFPEYAIQVWGMLPSDFQFVADQYKPFVGVVLFALLAASRLVKQKKLDCEKDDKPQE